MLEKIAGVCLVEKLRAIQLYEADFNCYNQFIFGKQAMQMFTDSGYIPEELFSQKGSTAKDAKFNKTLMVDLSWTSQTANDSGRCQHSLLLRQGKSCNNAVGLVSLDKQQHTSHSHGANMPTDDEILSEDRLWRVQDILGGSQLPALYDGPGTRE
jgi:hypothetical protein